MSFFSFFNSFGVLCCAKCKYLTQFTFFSLDFFLFCHAFGAYIMDDGMANNFDVVARDFLREIRACLGIVINAIRAACEIMKIHVSPQIN